MNNIWENLIDKKWAPLESDLKTEVVVIGGGITGILVAYELSERGHKVILLEAQRILGGTIANTTAKITALQDSYYQDLVKKYGFFLAKSYFQSQTFAIEQYKKLVEKYQIDCEFTLLDGHIYTRGKTKDIKKEFSTLLEFGANVSYLEKLDIPLEVTGAIKLANQARFDPLKFLSQLPINYDIYEESRVIDVDCKNMIVKTEKYQVKAKQIVVATHYPIINVPGLLFTKMYQSTSYVMAYKNAPKINGFYVEDVGDGFTFRSHRDYLMVGGLDHRTGRYKDENHFDQIDQRAKSIFGDLDCSSQWLASDCMTLDHLPIIGRLSKNCRNVFVATGYNKWGMSNSMLASFILSDMIEDKTNHYQKVVAPDRKLITKSLGSFVVNTCVVAKNLLSEFCFFPLCTEKSLKNDEGKIVNFNGRKRAVYKDKDGKLFAVQSSCTHLHCQLSFNHEAKSWDCPCHGSRFDIYGNILNDPSVKPLKVCNKHQK